MALTNFPFDPILDLDPWVGQRSSTYRFHRTNGLTGENLGDINPIRGGTLSHDTTRTIKRQLTFNLGVVDTAVIDPLVDRIEVFMVFPNGREERLGKYMFTDSSAVVATSGRQSNVVLSDEMFLVDQQITAGINGVGKSVTSVIEDVLDPLPVDFVIEASPFISAESWGLGVGRGQILESLSVSGDYFSPWFGNDAKMHFIRSFDPATQIPDFDFDAGNKVTRSGILETSDLLTSPNRFVVVSNAATNPEVAVVGTADVPPTAPHSFTNRGFYIAEVQDLQLGNLAQAAAVAQNIAQRQTIFERVNLNTAPDPRHDSYNVIKWQGDLWLELAWSIELVEGGTMSHLLRKSYRPS